MHIDYVHGTTMIANNIPCHLAYSTTSNPTSTSWYKYTEILAEAIAIPTTAQKYTFVCHNGTQTLQSTDPNHLQRRTRQWDSSRAQRMPALRSTNRPRGSAVESLSWQLPLLKYVMLGHRKQFFGIQIAHADLQHCWSKRTQRRRRPRAVGGESGLKDLEGFGGWLPWREHKDRNSGMSNCGRSLRPRRLYNSVYKRASVDT